jgi:hypothetical protein
MARKSFTFTESIYAPDLVKIMQAAEGPFTRKMLAEKLGELHPSMYWQQLMNEVSGALQQDKWSKANRFKVAKKGKGWYELTAIKKL